MCVCLIIIKKIYMDISSHKMRLILFLIQTFWKPGQSTSALETMSLREIGPQLKFPSVGGQGRDIVSTFAHFFLPPVA